MKTLTQTELSAAAGDYVAPAGYYHYVKSLPFLGSLKCNVSELNAGDWTELLITYEVGGSGLADGAWIKGTFKFYSDWALFQTSDPTKDNYVSAEYVPAELVKGQTPATVQGLSVRFDQKGHERPFQKAIIIDIVDGYVNPGDKIIVRLGDRRFGARGTRAQTFVEDKFLMRWYIDPVGTSRFAAIKPDIAIDIRSGPIHHLKMQAARLIQSNVPFPVFFHAEDVWGNTTTDLKGLNAKLRIVHETDDATGAHPVITADIPVAESGWTYGHLPEILLGKPGDYKATVTLEDSQSGSSWNVTEFITVSQDSAVPRILYGDLHVHSDDTVGTNNSEYNFSYAQKIAGLDVIGYTANDFHITGDRWASTLSLIRDINRQGEVIIFPGTEWCGNSAVGGDHNVVFLDDTETGAPPEFPLDRHGNVARSFEWNEHGPAELQPGAWPIDEVYATYAHAPDTHLMIPHVGGRRCNLDWHHPTLERLVEIGSAWGLFEWLLEDSVRRGWRMGVCANSDEHRGRCGGGVPGTAVFGTKGGLTGILAPQFKRDSVANSLRSRHTFATTGERLVGVSAIKNGDAIQGDDYQASTEQPTTFKYGFYGNHGFSSIEAFDSSGRIFARDLWQETATDATLQKVIRVTWGGARLYDRYREAVWDGKITVEGGKIEQIKPFGGVSYVPEEEILQESEQSVSFKTHTSGDFDGANLYLQGNHPSKIVVKGTLGGYVKVGDVLKGNPHKAQPEFELQATWDEIVAPGGKKIVLKGGADLFVRVEAVPDVVLPKRVEGVFEVGPQEHGTSRAVYFVGREWDGGKVITSPIFLDYV